MQVGQKDRSIISNFYDAAKSLLSSFEVASDKEINYMLKSIEYR